MAQKIPVVLNGDSKQHIPLSDSDTIRVGDIPVSAASGNIIQQRSDGLYAGVQAPPNYTAQFVDNESGSDTTGDGTRAAPYATIAKALSNMVPGTRGYTVYCHEDQEHVMPSRFLEGVSLEFCSYPSYLDNGELFSKVRDAWFSKYNAIVTLSSVTGIFRLATIIPDRVNPLNTTDPGGPYGYMFGLVSTNGNINFNSVMIKCGRRDMDVPVTGMQRAAFLSDRDLSAPCAYNINYCEVTLGSLPFVHQRGAGSNLTCNIYGTKLTGVADANGNPVFIQGWGSDAPRVVCMVGGESDGTQFVTVDGVDYYQRDTSGASAYARSQTTGVVYYGDTPLNIDAAFLFGKP